LIVYLKIHTKYNAVETYIEKFGAFKQNPLMIEKIPPFFYSGPTSMRDQWAHLHP
jgi:hypothetical protein